MGEVAWPLLTFGAGLLLSAAVGLVVRVRKVRTAAGGEGLTWGSPVVLLTLALVALAGLLLAIWGLNLQGTLGR